MSRRWEPYSLHDPAHVSSVGFVVHRSCATYHIGRLGSTVDDLAHDISDLSEV